MKEDYWIDLFRAQEFVNVIKLLFVFLLKKDFTDEAPEALMEYKVKKDDTIDVVAKILSRALKK